MIHSLRSQFNANFKEESYNELVRSIEKDLGVPVLFRISETPIFISPPFLESLLASARDLNRQLFRPDYIRESDRAIPPSFFASGETPHPTFIQTDFALATDNQGNYVPRLVELQGCASLHAFQFQLSHAYRNFFGLENQYLVEGMSDEGYLKLLSRAVIGDCDPEEVVLMEIEPELQKTLPDFVGTQQLLGVRTCSITDIYPEGKRLVEKKDGVTRPISRIYNRAIVDELIRKDIRLNFDYRDEYEVQWAGHPNWFFRLSKFSLPFLDHPSVPRCSFLSDLSDYPEDLENFVLKPLFSFAGSGVRVSITRDDLDQIAFEQRQDFLLQEKIHYAPAIETPDEPAKVEIRVMFVWPDGDPQPTPTLLLCRMSKGAMMGVDFNKNKTWVGASAGLF